MKKIFVLAAFGTCSMLSASPNFQYQNAQGYQPEGNANFQNAQQGYNSGNQYYQGQQPNYPGQQSNYINEQYYQTQPGQQQDNPNQQNFQGQQPKYLGQQYNQNQESNLPGQQQNNLNQPKNPSQQAYNRGQQSNSQYNDKSFYQMTHRSDADGDNDVNPNPRSNDQRNRVPGQIAQVTYGSKSGNPSSADEDLSKNVYGVLSAWLSTTNKNISFEVDNGKVTLTGVVSSKEEKEKIEKEVKKINGIKQVDNKITIAEPKKVAYYQPQRTTNSSSPGLQNDQKTKDYAALDSDKKLNAQIRDKLDKQLFETVVVITANGVVTLAGSVENLKDFQNTLKDIEQIDGVKKVNSKVNEKKQ